MLCENCHSQHKEKYGTGRFCSQKCARSFATKAKRKEINEKVSKTLKGRRVGAAGKPWSEERKLRARLQAKAPFLDPQNVVKAHEAQRKKQQKRLVETPFHLLSRKERKQHLMLEDNSCTLCGLPSHWNGKPLTLHLDHIDGNPRNNKRENVRLVCPNCHSQTETYTGRNKRRKPTIWYYELPNSELAGKTKDIHHREQYARREIRDFLKLPALPRGLLVWRADEDKPETGGYRLAKWS